MADKIIDKDGIKAEECKQDMKQFDLGPTNDLNGVEIFAAGTWNGDKYTVDDLDKMVEAFNETHERIRPYLKLGHDDKQKLLQKDGYPAAGYIKNMYRAGNKLVADFVHLPKVVYELIKAGGYRRVSSEIFVDMPVAGKIYKYLLKAVALLGADTPAVQTLKDMISLYASDGEVVTYDTEIKFKSYDIEINNNGGDNPMEKELEKITAQLAEATKKNAEAQTKIQELEGLQSQVKAYTTENEAIKKEVEDLKKQNEELQKQVKLYSEEKINIEINSQVDKLVNDKKISPAQREFIFALLLDAKQNGSAEKKYKIAEKELSKEDLILQFVQGNDSNLNVSEKSQQTSPHGKANQETSEIDKLDSKVREYLEKHAGATYRDALLAVSPEGIPMTGVEKAAE